MNKRSQIKGWLVAVLAAVVLAIAPMYYGIFATLNGPANKEKWFTPERQKDFDAWSERMLADGKPLELSRMDMSGALEAFAVSNNISYVEVSPPEKHVKWLIFGRSRVVVHYEFGNGNWMVTMDDLHWQRPEDFLTTMRNRQRVYLRNLLAVVMLLVLVLVLPKRLFLWVEARMPGWLRFCLILVLVLAFLAFLVLGLLWNLLCLSFFV